MYGLINCYNTDRIIAIGGIKWDAARGTIAGVYFLVCLISLSGVVQQVRSLATVVNVRRIVLASIFVLCLFRGIYFR